MKLYYVPGSCALAAHIVANEIGIGLDLVKVDLASRKTEHGDDYLTINPNGYVPALVLDDGQVLTEVLVLLQYLADQKPESGLIPAAGSMARYRVQEALSFVSTELHKCFGAFFKPGTPEETKASSRALLERRLAYLDAKLAHQAFVTGDAYTVADAYLWTVLGWTRFIKFDLASYANIQRFQGEVGARAAVQRSLKEEGLA